MGTLHDIAELLEAVRDIIILVMVAAVAARIAPLIHAAGEWTREVGEEISEARHAGEMASETAKAVARGEACPTNARLSDEARRLYSDCVDYLRSAYGLLDTTMPLTEAEAYADCLQLIDKLCSNLAVEGVKDLASVYSDIYSRYAYYRAMGYSKYEALRKALEEELEEVG